MKPKIIDDVTLAYPASVKDLIPYNEEGFKQLRENWFNSSSWGVKLFKDWFYIGLAENPKFYPKKGINPEHAIRHIRAIMRSFEPKHEDKTAACGFLFEHWFEKVEYKKKEKKDE